MGFEYKIVVKQSSSIKKDIESIINEIEQETVSKGNWPDVFIRIEEDGVYVCQNRTSDLWEGLEKLKVYLINNNLNYQIEEL